MSQATVANEECTPNTHPEMAPTCNNINVEDASRGHIDEQLRPEILQLIELSKQPHHGIMYNTGIPGVPFAVFLD